MARNLSGSGIRVAVIDSGVNPRHPHISGVAGGGAVRASVFQDGDYQDALGHGTAVMAAIQQHAPEASYFAVKLFHESLRASAENLCAAIGWAVEAQMDVINLSLGTRNPRHSEPLARLAQRAVDCGVVIVAAREARDEPCYPGCLPGTLGVRLDWTLPRTQYRRDDTAYCASGYPRPVPGVPPECNLRGISFAVANMSGFLARALSASGKRGIQAALEALGDFWLGDS